MDGPFQFVDSIRVLFVRIRVLRRIDGFGVGRRPFRMLVCVFGRGFEIFDCWFLGLMLGLGGD